MLASRWVDPWPVGSPNVHHESLLLEPKWLNKTSEDPDVRSKLSKWTATAMNVKLANSCEAIAELLNVSYCR